MHEQLLGKMGGKTRHAANHADSQHRCLLQVSGKPRSERKEVCHRERGNARAQLETTAVCYQGSVVHAVFTTSLERIKLNRELLKPLGTHIFYCNTDSAVYLAGEDL